ncbi:hypothetical protein [Anoxynatronum sibiricum]|uniref:ADP-heptose:LPS heptosyltransferase n=1 Tax=Anoxynatronum sibiricum TaxID=210623 RepID=A0ABU9VXZ1_9CLOT
MLTSKKWIEATNAIGLVAKAGNEGKKLKKTKAITLLQVMTAYLFGWLIAKYYLIKNKKTNYIMTFNSIGDACISLAFLDTYKEVNRIDHITIVAPNTNAETYHYFEGSYHHILHISKFIHGVLMLFFKSDLGYIFRRNHPRFINTFCTTYIRSDYLKYNKTIDVITLTKTIYQIPQHSKPRKLKDLKSIHDISYLIDKFDIKKKKTIIFNPYAHSISGVPFIIYEKISEKLSTMGYQLITSTIGNQTPIKGTMAIHFTIGEAVGLANYCGFVIGTRSGFFDLVVHSDAKIIAIDSTDYPWSDFYRLSQWQVNSELHEFRYNGSNVETIVSNVLSLLG